jgi:hypothetical protein
MADEIKGFYLTSILPEAVENFDNHNILSSLEL